MTAHSPYIRTQASIPVLMTAAAAAAFLPIAVSAFLNGPAILLTAAACIASSAVTEFICRGIFARDFSLHDMSSTVTGIILSAILPAGTPLWLAALSSAAAIIAGKQIFGGLGRNLFNPALTGLAFACGTLLVIRPHSAVLATIQQQMPPLFGKLHLPAAVSHVLSNPVFGFGSFGGTLYLVPAALALIALLIAGIIRWEIPFFAASGCLLTAWFASVLHLTTHSYVPAFALSGGFFFVISLMLTDPVTSPLTSGGRMIYGLLSGIVLASVWIITKNGYAAVLALLVCNLLSPLINKAFTSRSFR